MAQSTAPHDREASISTLAIDWSGLADELARLGRRREARRLYERDLHHGRNVERAASGLVALSLAEKQLAQAVELAKRSQGAGLSDTVTRELGLSLFRAGFWEEAGPWLTKAAAAAPGDPIVERALRRASRPDWLKPSTIDPSTGRQLTRFSARESERYIYAIDIVGTCNLRCPTCPVGNSPVRTLGFMDLSLFRSIIDKIGRECPCPHPHVNLYNWGEPLLHPDLPEMIGILRAAGMRSHLSSNLNIKRGLEAVIAANPDELKISISGFSPETYRRTHARGNLALVKANMRKVREFADRHGVTTRLWVSHHIYKSNRHEMQALREFSASLRFEYHPIEAFYMPLERLIEAIDGKPNPRDGGILTDLLHHPRDRLGPKAGTGQGLDCELRFNQTVINHDGTVALCCTVFDADNMLGVRFLDEPHASLEHRKYTQPFCGTCIQRGLHYHPPELRQTA